MATRILLEVEEISAVNLYYLPEEDRKRIISQSPRAKRLEEIEAMRLAFVRKYGDEFGQLAEKNFNL